MLARACPARPNAGLAAVFLVVAVLAVGCGGGGPTPSARPTAAALALTLHDLPPGWQAYASPPPAQGDSGPPPTVDAGAGFCDLRNFADTSEPVDRVLRGYSQGRGGPFLYETVATYRSVG